MAVTPGLFRQEQLNRIRPGAQVSDGQGGWIDGEPVVSVTKGAVQPLTQRDALIARQEGATVTHVLFCEWDEDWRRGDTLEAIDRDFEAQVVAVRRSSKPGHHMRVNLEERQPGSVSLMGSDL